ncbi:MAG TPA: hypothetical protein VD905_15295 [Flavobacteriales bacterium]|nr:hypothetical protein [Flavobacteriales bacterium]
MGSTRYWYYVPYREDYNLALKELREKEFEAGRYSPAVLFPEFPPTARASSPGKKHATIFDALDEAAEDGTRSILDLDTVSTVDDYGVARLLSDQDLVLYFNTTRPTRKDIENAFGFFESIERGKGNCIVVYKDNQPHELYFVGYSFD